METLNQSTNIALAFHKAKGRAEPDFRDDVVRHIDSPGRKVEFLPRVSEQRGKLGEPSVYPMVDQRFHFLDITECIRACSNLPVVRVNLMLLHVEKTLHFAETAGDVVVALVRLPIVDFGEFRSV